MDSRIIVISLALYLSSCATDSIENRQHGQELICHHGKKTLTVSTADSFVHLQHGDTVGPCPASDT
jgi:hypothetical protein